MDEILLKLVEIAKETPVIKRIWVFGSRFKNTHNSNSDLDIAVEVEWVSGEQLGCCEDTFSLWCAASPKFEERMKAECPWTLDLQQYAGQKDTPKIHRYLEECSRLIYQKHN